MHKLKSLLQILLLLFASYFLMRLCFLVGNFNSFSFASVADYCKVFFYGLRFDASAIAFTNALFILLYVLPLKVFYSKGYQQLLKVVFLVSNLPAFVFNFIDAGYFRFTQKRTTADFLDVISMGDDFKNMLPQILADYWYLLVLFVLMSIGLVWCYNRVASPHLTNDDLSVKAEGLGARLVKLGVRLRWLILPLTAGVLLITARGGSQYKPLSILGAARYTTTQNVAVVLNTTFTVIKTLGKEELEEISLDKNIKPADYFNPIHNYAAAAKPFQKKNVVIIIMESFSKEYTGWFNNGQGHTPFLDSLMNKSFVCIDAFANGKKSIEGIPALVSGIPALMNSSYISSTYNGNKLNSLPILLKKFGYKSAFFHGGNNGTMGFDSFTRMAGFDKYVGRNEYKGTEYDGTWGIYDEPFFKFYCNEMSNMSQPFVTTFFSLTSHHPYKIPMEFETSFGKNLLPFEKSIRYADYSLQQFFNCASKQAWYNNTLFVIAADHTGPVVNPAYKNRTGIYSIPIIFFDPQNNLHGVDSSVSQQTDIVPSVLHYINYPEQFKFYGQSVFDSTRKGFAINYLAGIYQLIVKDYVINFDGEKVTGFYERKAERTGGTMDEGQNPLLRYMRVEGFEDTLKKNKDWLEIKLKVIIADYNSSMIHNKLTQK